MNVTQDLETIKSAIKNRRSFGISRLKPDAVNREYIEEALEAANWGQSHGDTEPWRFIVYTGESRAKLGAIFAEAYRAEAGDDFKQNTCDSQFERAQSSPVWIAIGMVPKLHDGEPLMNVEEEMMGVATAVQNLHLVAAARGLAGMWLSKGVFISPLTAKEVGLTQPHSRLLGFYVLGWPNIEWPEGERGPVEDKVVWHD